MSLKHLAVYALITLVLLAIPVYAAKPDWAKEGNWAVYEMSMKTPIPQLGKEVKIWVKMKLTIVSVSEKGFKVRAEVLKLKVEPKEVAEMMKPFIEAMKGQMSQEQFISFDSKFSPQAQQAFYVNPETLPSGGVYEKSEKGVSYRVVYDVSTGWLREAHIEQEMPYGKVVANLKLVDSNFMGGAGAGLDTTTIALIVGVCAAAAIAAALILFRKG